MMRYKENLQKCHEYVRALEEERRKIQMFQRELPLCLEIVSQTLESCKQQLSGTNTATATATATTTTTECSEQTTSDGLVFEEFIPLKKTCGGEEGDDGDVHELDESKKSDWLRSAQLWNQSPDLVAPTTEEVQEEHRRLLTPGKKVAVVEVKSMAMETAAAAASTRDAAPAAGAAPPAAPAASACSTAERGGSKKEEGQNRKARRCWSAELHRRFLKALEQLGGPHVATPKQIRELMKVDGLTNDEVKSHLQKYRLHSTRRPTASAGSQHSKGAPPHQFVVVGGMWAPGGSPGVVCARPSQQAARTSHSAGSHSENGTRCSNSPATSSSARESALRFPAC